MSLWSAKLEKPLILSATELFPPPHPCQFFVAFPQTYQVSALSGARWYFLQNRYPNASSCCASNSTRHRGEMTRSLSSLINTIQWSLPTSFSWSSFLNLRSFLPQLNRRFLFFILTELSGDRLTSPNSFFQSMNFVGQRAILFFSSLFLVDLIERKSFVFCFSLRWFTLNELNEEKRIDRTFSRSSTNSSRKCRRGKRQIVANVKQVETNRVNLLEIDKDDAPLAEEISIQVHLSVVQREGNITSSSSIRTTFVQCDPMARKMGEEEEETNLPVDLDESNDHERNETKIRSNREWGDWLRDPSLCCEECFIYLFD